MSTLDPVDAGNARELAALASPRAVLDHYAAHGEDYDGVSLAHALHKATELSAAQRPWKRDIAPAKELQTLAAHAASALREGLRVDAELQVRGGEARSGARDARNARRAGSARMRCAIARGG